MGFDLITIFKDILEKTGWQYKKRLDKFDIYYPPEELSLPTKYEIYLPVDSNYKDIDRFINIFYKTLADIYNIVESSLKVYIEQYPLDSTAEEVQSQIESLKKKYSFFKIYKGNSIRFKNTFVVTTIIDALDTEEKLTTEYFTLFIDSKGNFSHNAVRTVFPKSYFEYINEAPHIAAFEDAYTQSKEALYLIFDDKFKDNNDKHTWDEIDKACEIKQIDKRNFINIIISYPEVAEYLKQSACKEFTEFLQNLASIPTIDRKEI